MVAFSHNLGRLEYDKIKNDVRIPTMLEFLSSLGPAAFARNGERSLSDRRSAQPSGHKKNTKIVYLLSPNERRNPGAHVFTKYASDRNVYYRPKVRQKVSMH